MFHLKLLNESLQGTSSPPYAAKDLVSGGLYGLFGSDIKTDLDACIPDDQVTANLAGDLIDALADHNWGAMHSYYTQFKEHFAATYKSHKDQCNQKVQQAMQEADSFYAEFESQSGWKDIVQKNLDENRAVLNGYATQMSNDWNSESFYEAGMLGGLVEQILFGKLAVQPAYAGRDFLAGNVFGLLNDDVKADMDACIPDDQLLSDINGGLINAVRVKDWHSIFEFSTQLHSRFAALYSENYTSCSDGVHDAFDELATFYEDFFNQEDWHSVISQNIATNHDAIYGYIQQLLTAWDGGKYYEAGNLSGLVDQIVCSTSDNVPSTAGIDFVAGNMLGMFGSNIQSGLTQCIPEDATLSDLTTDLINAIDSEDWHGAQETILSLAEQLTTVASESWENCGRLVQYTLSEANLFYKEFFSQPDWREIIKENMEGHKAQLIPKMRQMIQDWNAGNYFDSGKTSGQIDQILLNHKVYPASAGRDFVAGSIFAMFGPDIKADMDACIPDDQILSDMSGNLVNAIQDEAWGVIQNFAGQFTGQFRELASDSWAGCSSNVHTALSDADDFYKSFMAQEKWQDIVTSNLQANLHYVQGYKQQMQMAWDNQQYYEAGKLLGLIDQLIFGNVTA